MVRENVATASIDKPLTQEERRQISAALEEKKKLSIFYCTGCGYCIPCPNGVNIPRNFELMNYARLYGLVNYARSEYQKLGERVVHWIEYRSQPDREVVDGVVKPAWAAACQECGKCEEKCPQKMDIRKQLKETHATLF